MSNHHYVYETVIQVDDINYGGHLGNDSVLTLCHRARVNFLRSLNLSETDIGQGVGIILKEAHIKYESEGFLGDAIEIMVSLGDFRNASFKMNYTILKTANQIRIATVETQQVTFDYKHRKISLIPKSFSDLFVPSSN